MLIPSPHSASASPNHPRRDFLSKLGLGAATLAAGGSLSPLIAEQVSPAARHTTGAWDTRWVERLTSGQFRVAFDATAIDDGSAPNHAAAMFDQYHEFQGTPEDQLRVVIVMRQLGTAMGINDAMWERYPIDDRKKNDPSKPPAKRNPYWAIRPDRSPEENASQLESLTKRGAIVLVCNIALTNVARAMARATEKNPDEVVAEFKQNLIPGATLVPSGVFAMARAQNAGCAYMRG